MAFFLSNTLLATIMQIFYNLDNIVPKSQKQNLEPSSMVEYNCKKDRPSRTTQTIKAIAISHSVPTTHRPYGSIF